MRFHAAHDEGVPHAEVTRPIRPSRRGGPYTSTPNDGGLGSMSAVWRCDPGVPADLLRMLRGAAVDPAPIFEFTPAPCKASALIEALRPLAEVQNAVAEPGTTAIKIIVKNGKSARVHVEKEVVVDDGMAAGLLTAEYQTLTVQRFNGKVTRATTTTPHLLK